MMLKVTRFMWGLEFYFVRDHIDHSLCRVGIDDATEKVSPFIDRKITVIVKR